MKTTKKKKIKKKDRLTGRVEELNNRLNVYFSGRWMFVGWAVRSKHAYKRSLLVQVLKKIGDAHGKNLNESEKAELLSRLGWLLSPSVLKTKFDRARTAHLFGKHCKAVTETRDAIISGDPERWKSAAGEFHLVWKRAEQRWPEKFSKTPECWPFKTSTNDGKVPEVMLSRTAAMILDYLKREKALRTYDEILNDLDLGRGTVNKYLKELQAKGLVARPHGPKGGVTYRESPQ